MCIYWIHRGLHHKKVYKYIHKAHHIWKVPTPFASHAFHPVDGFLQSCPYHIYPFLFPLHKFTYLGLFVFVNFWTVSIHDGYYRVPDTFKPIVNGSAHHTDHHLFYNFNYGQFFTLWDRIGKTFRNPSAFEGNGPMVEALKAIDLTDENKNTTKNKADWWRLYTKVTIRLFIKLYHRNRRGRKTYYDNLNEIIYKICFCVTEKNLHNNFYLYNKEPIYIFVDMINVQFKNTLCLSVSYFVKLYLLLLFFCHDFKIYFV